MKPLSFVWRFPVTSTVLIRFHDHGIQFLCSVGSPSSRDQLCKDDGLGLLLQLAEVRAASVEVEVPVADKATKLGQSVDVAGENVVDVRRDGVTPGLEVDAHGVVEVILAAEL